jgi:cephalosporin hydroxylase
MSARNKVGVLEIVFVIAATVLASAGCRDTPGATALANGNPSATHPATKDLDEKALIDRFHVLYYSRQPYINSYLGIESAQYPNDNWMMQEMIAKLMPDFIVETGTLAGGTSLFYADILEKVHPRGRVITVDIVDKTQQAATFRNWRQRVRFLHGSSVDPAIVERIAGMVRGARTVMVTLDSDHNKGHVLKELNAYAPMVT